MAPAVVAWRAELHEKGRPGARLGPSPSLRAYRTERQPVLTSSWTRTENRHVETGRCWLSTELRARRGRGRLNGCDRSKQTQFAQCRLLIDTSLLRQTKRVRLKFHVRLPSVC